MDPIVWLMLLLLLAALLWLATQVFGHGARRQFINQMPVGRLLLLSLGPPLFRWVIDSLTADPDARPLLNDLGLGAFVFAGGAVIWLTGLFYGRWRESRRDGVLKRR